MKYTIKDWFFIVAIGVLICSLVRTARQRDQAVELNEHRGTFDSLKKLHHKIEDDNGLKFSYLDDVDLLYKVNGELFFINVIADKWELDGSRELVLTYQEDGQKRLLREREPKWSNAQGEN